LLLKQALGHALYFERTRQKLTLRDVALHAPIAVSYLSEVERGKKEISSEILTALANSLGKQTSDILRETYEILALEEKMALEYAK
jgi:transcriptional regulator with XRE-family HTH domain